MPDKDYSRNSSCEPNKLMDASNKLKLQSYHVTSIKLKLQSHHVTYRRDLPILLFLINRVFYLSDIDKA